MEQEVSVEQAAFAVPVFFGGQMVFVGLVGFAVAQDLQPVRY